MFEWINQNGSKLGEGQYETVIAKTKQIAKEFPSEEMALHYHGFRFGFSFFYAKKEGENKYIPIVWRDGFIMKWQANNEGGSCWPILDTQKNTYITPKVTVIDHGPQGSSSTNSYINDLLDAAELDQNSDEFRILEALTPYAKLLNEACGAVIYDAIRRLIPAYPQVPV